MGHEEGDAAPAAVLGEEPPSRIGRPEAFDRHADEHEITVDKGRGLADRAEITSSPSAPAIACATFAVLPDAE